MPKNTDMMKIFRLHSEMLKEEWLDGYGHLNEAYYLVPFSNTTWLLQDQFGIGMDYFHKTACAVYTVETHIRYLYDVRQPAIMDIQSIILGSDTKRIWFAHQMLVGDKVCATGEFMALHHNTSSGRTENMPEEVQARLKAAEVEEKPPWVSRQIGLT